MITALKTLWADEDGLSTVEYALLLVLVAIAGIVAWGQLGTAVGSKVTEVKNTVAGA